MNRRCFFGNLGIAILGPTLSVKFGLVHAAPKPAGLSWLTEKYYKKKAMDRLINSFKFSKLPPEDFMEPIKLSRKIKWFRYEK